MIKLTYKWLHIPTGKQGERAVEFKAPSIRAAQEQLFENLNDWQRPGVWQYWA